MIVRCAAIVALVLAGLVATAAAGETVVSYRFPAAQVRAAAGGSVRMGSLPLRADPDGYRLPYRIARILLPQGTRAADVRVEADWGDWFSAPSLERETGGFPLNATARSAASTLQSTVRADDPAIAGTFRLEGAAILFVRLDPVQADAATGRVRAARSMTVRVATEPAAGPAGLPYRGLAADNARIARAVDNPEALRAYAPVPPLQDWEMLVITSADMAGVFGDYATYKTDTLGITTHVEIVADILASTSGDDPPDKVRNFIRAAYEQHGTRYVLLGGDADGLDPAGHIVPARCLWGHAETVTNPCLAGDLYFGNLDGTWDDNGNDVYGEMDDGEGGGEVDLLAEVFVGRVPADDATEAKRQLDKMRTYDGEDPRLGAILYGEKLWPAPAVWGGDLKDLAFAEMPGMTATRMYEKDGSYTADGLVAAINSNENSLINASEHGNWYNGLGLFDIDLPPVHNQLPELTNTYPFLGYSHGCYTGSFDNRTVIGTYNERDAIAEELLTGLDAGAFAIVTNSREGFADWSETGGASSGYDIAFMHALFADGVDRLGETLAAARETFIGNLADNQGANRWIFFDLNLLGDPHQRFRTSADEPDDDTDDDVADDDASDDDAADDDSDDSADDDAGDDDSDTGAADDDDDDGGCCG